MKILVRSLFTVAILAVSIVATFLLDIGARRIGGHFAETIVRTFMLFVTIWLVYRVWGLLPRRPN